MDRRELLARYCRLKAIEEERERAKTKVVFAQDNPWHTASDVYKQEQMEYTRSHRAQQEAESQQPATNGNASNAADEQQELEEEFDRLEVVTVRSERRDVWGQLANLRGGRRCRKAPSSVASSSVSDIDQLSTVLAPTVKPEEYNTNIEARELYDRYFSTYKNNINLPIYKYRAHIVNSINSYGVILIEGATGCGKTTQVPLYVLEDAIKVKQCKNSPVIYVTQPRRIAARSIAERICAEHNWEMGSIVGYQVSLEKAVKEQTVLVFCTAGVLLQKLIQEKTLGGFTHIIIDEAHERDADTDLLLMMIRTLMRKEMKYFRLIVMSATMDSSKLKRYFTFKTTYGHQALTTPANIEIPVCRQPSNVVQTLTFDKLNQLYDLEITDEPPVFEMENPELHEYCLKAATKLITDIIPNLDTFGEDTKSTLVFLPGYAEISKLDRKIKSIKGAMDHIDIIPLHSCLTVPDQVKVFQPARPGCRKVILATNIAESSITVPDVGFIIDFCLTKTLMKDPITRFPTLRLQWSSQDKCIQRAGRTGRCCSGKVFRMVPNSFFEKFSKFAEPELLTSPLELSVLRVKNFNMGELQELFAELLDPPPFVEIRTAVLELKQIGALSSTYRGAICDTDGDVTELGKIISSLPIDVRLSKLIVIASVFDVMDEAIVVAACLSTNRTVVRHIYGNSLETYDNKLEWANGSNSDLFVCLDVYNEFHEMKSNLGKSDKWLGQWCYRKGLDERKLYDVDALVIDIIKRLENLNIRTVDQPNRQRQDNEDNLMLKIAFCAAFYPNYFITQPFDVDAVKKELCGMDPTKTVIMHNIPVNQVPLYRSQVLKQIANVCEDVEFIADCSRALLILNDDVPMEEDESVKMAIGDYNVMEPSRLVRRSVYRAIKLGDTGECLQIREYKDIAAHERMQYYEKQKEQISRRLDGRLLPPWFKIVDRPADNRRFFEATPDEFLQMTNGFYHVELSFNQARDEMDANELFELEKFEESQTKVDKNICAHHDFKNTWRRIMGPRSPIRMQFRSVLVKSKGYSVDIDPHSVNSILLDPEFERERRQLLVAAAVTQGKRGKVLARDTTLMPNIRGLQCIMALLFAQYYKMVYNIKMNCIVGGVFGIGWQENGQPIDKLYEVELGFDVLITPDDMSLINKARQRVSELLRFTERSGKPQAQQQRQLRDIILTLMRKRRYPLLDLDLRDIDLNRADFFEETNCVYEGQESVVDGDAEKVLPFMPIMKLSRSYSELDTFKAIRANLEFLGKIERGEAEVPHDGLRCLVCGNSIKCFLMGYMYTLDHIRSESHMYKVNEFEEYERIAIEREQRRGQMSTQ